MSGAPTYTVSRQSNYYDDGAYSVEVAAREFEHMSPGALVAKYAGEFEEFSDPREACEVAIAVRAAWHSDGARQDEDGTLLRFTIAGNHFVYPTVADGLSAAALRRWAREEWARLPKCDRCGAVCEAPDNWSDCFGFEVTACGQFCADELLAPCEDEDCEVIA